MKQHPKFLRYFITEDSVVWDSLNKKVLNTYIHTNGYVLVSLMMDTGESKLQRVHRLSCEAYHTDSDFYGLDVNHKNGVKTDNHIDNLEWCTRSYNIKHAIDMGFNPSKGETHPQAILTEAEVHTICKMLEDGARSIDIAVIFKVHKDTIAQIKMGNNWVHVTCDYNFIIKRKDRLSKDSIIQIYIASNEIGANMKFIADKFNTTSSTVLRIKKKQIHSKFIEGFLNDYRNPIVD